MEKLIFDTGVKSYQINDGVLRFNPRDPNVYARLMKAGDKLIDLEMRLTEKGKALDPQDEKEMGKATAKLLEDADREAKKILKWIFGASNDFDQIFGGVNIMAVAENGERVITNFFAAITPIVEQGAKQCANDQIGNAVAQAQMNRAQRRAAAKK